jgi:2-(1,2-epoxy-1,2-dihydrophenyl)acetyl-CoA isomerase
VNGYAPVFYSRPMSSPENEQPVLYTVDGAIATVTLNRPDARNAYTDEMIAATVEAFDRAEADDAVRCVILTGAGQSFSAGGDLKLMQTHSGMFEGGPVALRKRYQRGVQTIPTRLESFDKPVVAALNGAAVGAGLDLACMCDIRIASSEARFGSPFVKLGLIPGDGGAYLLGRVVGFARALELMLTGRLIDAEEALRIGLVTRVVAPDAVLATAREVAEGLAALAPLAVQLTKRAAYRAYDESLAQTLERAATYQGVVQNSADHDEGVAALLEKRAPRFRGE